MYAQADLDSDDYYGRIVGYELAVRLLLDEQLNREEVFLKFVNAQQKARDSGLLSSTPSAVSAVNPCG